MTPEEITRQILLEAKSSSNPELYIAASLSTMEKHNIDLTAIIDAINSSRLDIKKIIGFRK